MTCPLGFKVKGGSALFAFYRGECNVDIYIPREPPLVLHMPTSWQLAVQLVTSPHALAEVPLGSDLSGKSPRQKTKTLPLYQQPS